MLYEENKLPVGGVTGSDRADTYKQMIGRMFGDAVKRQYVCEIIQRDPDSLDTSAISGSKVRQSILEDDFPTFKSMVNLNNQNALNMFNTIKIQMEKLNE